MDYVCHRFVLTIIPYFCSVITRHSADQMLWIKKPWSGVVFIIVTTEYNIGGVREIETGRTGWTINPAIICPPVWS